MKALNNILHFEAKETRLDLEKESFEHKEFMLFHKTFDHSKLKAYQGYYCSKVRVLFHRKGSTRYLINSVAYDIEAPTILIIPAGSIFSITDNGAELDNIGFTYNEDTFPIMTPHVLHVTPVGEKIFNLYMDIMWELVKTQGYDYEVINPLLNSLAQWYVRLHPEKRAITSDQTIMKFLRLVNQYSGKERSLNFYADKLYMTPHYLSAYIRKVSGQTFTEWINYSVMQKINILLRFTESPLNEIAEDLNFTNTAELSRYYKRQTGITPYKFRKSL